MKDRKPTKGFRLLHDSFIEDVLTPGSKLAAKFINILNESKFDNISKYYAMLLIVNRLERGIKIKHEDLGEYVTDLIKIQAQKDEADSFAECDGADCECNHHELKTDKNSINIS